MRTCLLLGLAGLASACATTVPGGGPHAAFWRTNGFDNQGERQGRWRQYYNDDPKQPWTAGRFRHGRPVGHWRYYAQNSALDHEERYRRKFSRITFYYPNGVVARQGRAAVADEHPNIHYFWFGDWREFSRDGQLQRIDTYERGKLVGSKSPTGEALSITESVAK